MPNNYVLRVNEAVVNQNVGGSNPVVLAGEQIEQALAWHNSEDLPMLDAVATDLDVESLSANDRHILRQRVFGGMATRLVFGSFMAHANDPQFPAFTTLPLDSQTGVLVDSVYEYARNLKPKLGDIPLSQTFDTSHRAHDLASASDPVRVPHRYVRQQLHAYKAAQLSRKDHLGRIVDYLKVKPGSFHIDTYGGRSVATPDSILVQAFGRNNIPDDSLPVISQMHANVIRSGGNDEAMWEILSNDQFDAGESNTALANTVARQLMGPNLVEPVIQWEAAYALWKYDPDLYEQRRNSIHTLWPSSDFYPTFEVKRESVAVMDKVGLYNPLELAHPDMLSRALGILSKLGVEADPLLADVPFDKRSVQRQTRDPLRWTARELLARVEHVLHGRVKL